MRWQRRCVNRTAPQPASASSKPAIALASAATLSWDCRSDEGVMRQENGAYRSVLKDVARGPAQKASRARAAYGIGAHDQQAGFMLCPRREQRIAHRAQFPGATTCAGRTRCHDSANRQAPPPARLGDCGRPITPYHPTDLRVA